MTDLTRRHALAAAAGLGLSVSFIGQAQAADSKAARRKLVVVICRGAMDGLSVSPPIGDASYLALRGKVAVRGALPLDSDFGLHPKLTAIHTLAKAGQARIAPAVAIPNRGRSHFAAQDVLENGDTARFGTTSGWLNRALGAMGPGKPSGLSVGSQAPLILRGAVQTAAWSPGGLGESLPRLPSLLADLYADDPLLGPALQRGLQTQSLAKTAMLSDDDDGPGKAPKLRGADAARALGGTVARMMTGAGGPGVVALSLNGFDTHSNQGAATGRLAGRLAVLDALTDGMVKGLGPAWRETAILVVTEFGRTARVNGTGGTDHGTASTAILLGGGLKRGGIIGDWPTLKASALYEGRDTAPALDMRALYKGVLAGQFGLDRAALDTAVFPGSASVAAVGGLIA